MNPFIGQIIMFGGNFAPRGWALCEGQLLAISTNTALFSILGTTYGGDGRTTFALPDMRGRTPIGPGIGPGLPSYRLGQKSGTPTNTLTTAQIPSHNHSAAGRLKVNNTPGITDQPEGNYPTQAGGRTVATPPVGVQLFTYTNSQNAFGANDGVEVTIGNTGGSQSVNNMQPFQAVNFIIALVGVFPSRS